MNVKVTIGRIAGALALATVAAATGAAVSSPAIANDGTCGRSDLCLYQDTNFNGGRWDNFGAVMDYSSGQRWWGTTVSINDSASSVRNKHSTAAGICKHSYGRGDCVAVGGNFEINILADYEFDNQASSNIW